MGEVVMYQNAPGRPVFCQIKLDSGERVLITVAQREVKIIARRSGGRQPAATLWRCDDVGRLVELFADPAHPSKHPLDAMRDKILATASVEELRHFLETGP